MHVMGLDVSTSVVGVVVLDACDGFDPTKHIVHYEAVDLGKCKTFWEKCDLLHQRLLVLRLGPVQSLSALYVEEPMKRFAEGFSSAETVSILQRFNGIACYIAREDWKVDPTYVNVSSARKAAGVRVTTKAKAGGKNAKMQTFEHMMSYDLVHMQGKWPTKRNSTEPKPFVYDIVDAYVVARGGMVLSKQDA